MVEDRLGERDAVDHLRGAGAGGPPLQARQGQLVLAGRLGGPRQPVVVRRLVGRPGDLVAVAVDQPAVLAEDDQGVGLRHDQVAVPGDQVPPLALEGVQELDRRVGDQPGRLVEDVDLGPGRPVDPVAGQDSPAEPLRPPAVVGPGVVELPGLDVEPEDAVAGGDQVPFGHAEEVGELDLVGDRRGLPGEPAGGGLVGVDRRGVVGAIDHEAVVDDRRVQVALAIDAPFPARGRSPASRWRRSRRRARRGRRGWSDRRASGRRA